MKKSHEHCKELVWAQWNQVKTTATLAAEACWDYGVRFTLSAVACQDCGVSSRPACKACRDSEAETHSSLIKSSQGSGFPSKYYEEKKEKKVTPCKQQEVRSDYLHSEL